VLAASPAPGNWLGPDINQSLEYVPNSARMPFGCSPGGGTSQNARFVSPRRTASVAMEAALPACRT